MNSTAHERVVPLSMATAEAPARGAATPDRALAENRLLTGDTTRQITNAYNTVRARVLAHVERTDNRRVAVVSPVTGDGKSLSAANLAISIARDFAHSAALLDFDLHRPSLGGLFQLEVDRGVDDFLVGEDLPLSRIGQSTAFDGLTVYPVRRPRARASELVAGDRAAALIADITQTDPSRIVVIDLPPLLATPDAQLTATRCGGVLLVVRDGHTPTDSIERALELLREHTVVGAMLNESDDVATHYYAY